MGRKGEAKKKKKHKRRRSDEESSSRHLKKTPRHSKETKWDPSDQFSEEKGLQVPDLLSLGKLEDAELWLIQLPHEISNLDQLAAAEWSIDASLEGAGALGEVVFDDERRYSVQVEDAQFNKDIVMQTQLQTQHPISKTIILHRGDTLKEEF